MRYYITHRLYATATTKVMALLLHCFSKNIPDASYDSRMHCRIFITFGRNITYKVSNQQMHIFSHSLINASALPCETENTEIVSFHANVANRHTVTSKLSPNHC